MCDLILIDICFWIEFTFSQLIGRKRWRFFFILRSSPFYFAVSFCCCCKTCNYLIIFKYFFSLKLTLDPIDKRLVNICQELQIAVAGCSSMANLQLVYLKLYNKIQYFTKFFYPLNIEIKWNDINLPSARNPIQWIHFLSDSY